MWTSNKLAVAALLLALATVARADGIGGGVGGADGVGNGVGDPSGISATKINLTPPPPGKILLVDAASHILQTDATSKICRAGGC